MARLIRKLGPYAKPLALLGLLGAAGLADAAGVTAVELDTEAVWTALGGSLVVYLTPAPGYRSGGDQDDDKQAPSGPLP